MKTLISANGMFTVTNDVPQEKEAKNPSTEIFGPFSPNDSEEEYWLIINSEPIIEVKSDEVDESPL